MRLSAPPLIDYGTGAQAAFAISAALFQRSQTGKGQVVEINMLYAALMMMSPQVADAIHRGGTDKRGGNMSLEYAGYVVYPCEDDDLMVSAFTPAQNLNLLQVLGVDESLDIPDPLTATWLKQNLHTLRNLMLPIFATHTAAAWETALNEHNTISIKC